MNLNKDNGFRNNTSSLFQIVAYVSVYPHFHLFFHISSYLPTLLLIYIYIYIYIYSIFDLNQNP